MPTIKFRVNRNYHVKDEEIQAVKRPCTAKDVWVGGGGVGLHHSS